MPGRFDYFVIFAEMRTGSNFLETNLNALDGVVCHGEAFNPYFIGYPKRRNILGITKAARDSDPQLLVRAIREQEGVLGGFRFFHDHDPRVTDGLLEDPRCAKIILTRNPAETYVSWKIAQATGQWKLTDIRARKTERIAFDAAEFAAHADAQQAFRLHLLRRLQRSGQTAFCVDYEDLNDLAVMNGIARFLDVPARLDALDTTLKVQNPGPIADKVINFSEMQEALVGYDRFNLSTMPSFEPRRSAGVHSYVAAHQAPLIFLPIQGGPTTEVQSWLTALEDASPVAPRSGIKKNELNQWKAMHAGHRSFTVLRHPLARAHHVFCEKILSTAPGSYRRIRRVLVKQYGLTLPRRPETDGWTTAQHRAAFAQFLDFLKCNLAGQTPIRVDAAWCSQSVALRGFSEVAVPDCVLREEDLQTDLPALAARAGIAQARPFEPSIPRHPVPLAEIYDAELEESCKSVYRQDYLTFGFDRWDKS